MDKTTKAATDEMQMATDVANSCAGMLLIRDLVLEGGCSVKISCFGHDTCDTARRTMESLAMSAGVDGDAVDAATAAVAHTGASITVGNHLPATAFLRAFRDDPLMGDIVRTVEAAMEHNAHVVIGAACVGDGIAWGASALFGRFGLRGVVEYAARARAWKAPKVGYDKRGRWKVLAPESTDATSARPVMEPVLLHCGFRRGVHLDGGECWSHDDPALDNSTFVRASKLLLARLVAGAESVQSPGAPADSRRPTGRHLRGA